MPGQVDEHLSADAIHRLASTRLASTGPKDEWSSDAVVRAHLEVCDQCRARLGAHYELVLLLTGLRAPAGAVRTEACPPEPEWRWVVAGLRTPQEMNTLLRHAMDCGYCGARLREAAEILAEPASPADQPLLDALDQTRSRRVAELAALRRQASVQGPGTKAERAGRFPRWLWAAAAAVVIISCAAWLSRFWVSRPPAELIAKAYTERRVLEMRIPLAQYAPMANVRATRDNSSLRRPLSLIDAEHAIAHGLEGGADRPAWLQAKGRVDLLNLNYEEAAASFREALQLKPDDPALLTDLASAFFERAQLENGREIDYGQSIELLGQALAKSPEYQIALYNRAVAYEAAHLYNEAAADWEHYLRLDSSGAWADEARKKLQEIRRLLNKKDQGAFHPASGPSAFLAQLHSVPDTQAASEIWESYLPAAVNQWLPGKEREGAARDALTGLAGVLDARREHWLSELLAMRPSPAITSAIQDLSAAAVANTEARHAEGLRLARSAAGAFRRAGLTGASLRSRFEEIYALQRTARGRECAEGAEQAAGMADPARYAWLATQMELERSACAAMIPDFGASRDSALRALKIARPENFPGLYLRALGFSASLSTVTGDHSLAWTNDIAGLSTYWSGQYAPARAHQFYDDMSFWAEESGRWRLALALAREAVRAVAQTDNRLVEGLARLQLASFAEMAGVPEEAAESSRAAASAFASLNNSKEIGIYQAQGQINLANVEIGRGDLASARGRLDLVRGQLSGISNYLITAGYHRSRADLERRSGDWRAAEQSLGALLSLVERGLVSLQEPRDRLIWNRYTEQAYRDLVELTLRARGDADGALELLEWAHSAPLRQRGSASILPVAAPENAAGLSVARLAQEAMPHLTKQTVLAYAVVHDGLAIWAYDDRGAMSRWVPVEAARLNALAVRFSAQCSDPESNMASLRETARGLYDLLIGPVAAHLSRERALLIEADGDLARIPFQALLTPEGDYLGDQYSMAQLPGIGWHGLLRPVHPLSREAAALIVGSPALAPSLAGLFAPLPDATAEAHAAADLFHGSVILTGKSATRDAVEGALPVANVFHFAGHTLSSGGRTGLLLAGASAAESTLPAARLRSELLRKCDLAVLSACSTNRLPEQPGADPQTLARAFLDAGVPQVIASRWNVDSATTSALMRLFYGELLAGRSATYALRKAAAQVRREQSRQHPYYWSAFSVFGRDS